MRKGLTILLIIILLAAGGFWLYGKFFAPVDDSANNINQAIPPLPQNHQEPPLDLNINLSASEQLATSTERIDQKPATTTPQSNLSQVEVDKTIKISINKTSIRNTPIFCE